EMPRGEYKFESVAAAGLYKTHIDGAASRDSGQRSAMEDLHQPDDQEEHGKNAAERRRQLDERVRERQLQRIAGLFEVVVQRFRFSCGGRAQSRPFPFGRGERSRTIGGGLDVVAHGRCLAWAPARLVAAAI